MAFTPGFEPRPHWWEASALTTAQLLLSTFYSCSACFLNVLYRADHTSNKNLFHLRSFPSKNEKESIRVSSGIYLCELDNPQNSS